MQTAISLLGWFGAFICLVIYLQVKRAEIKRGYFSTLLPVLGPALLALDGGYKGAWFLVFLYGLAIRN